MMLFLSPEPQPLKVTTIKVGDKALNRPFILWFRFGCLSLNSDQVASFPPQQEPYTMSKGTEFEGFCMDLLSALAEKLSFKYNVRLVKDGKYGTKDERGNWAGMIGEVVRGVSSIQKWPI